ncbi:MAG TPA: InlB B-repeat-containing protein [Candidatus Gallimonas intestinigallinarum]|uniref:InlB B-repeat-containing protein n=1 Tax=Candidatus Gallimonas intestinigallinarum TaxID=2838604 RepID=A0A9D2IUR2_9FIRM|nr:InlB B-repeat-containing protein [Candidatus Gallimonas intestinigallinarum]
MSEFSERLKELVKAANITQTQLADKLNLHPQTVSKWERGLSEPDISQLGEIAAALGITMEKLCGQAEAEQTFVGDFHVEQLGKMISEQRIARNESQEQLASFMQTSTDAVSRWERGVTCPDVAKLIALADHFALPVSRLWCGIGEEQSTESVAVAQKRHRMSVAIAAAAIMVCLTVILLAILLPRGQASAQSQVYMVSVDGEEVSVPEGTWYMPETPLREGYDFVGWRDAQGEIVTFPCAVTEDMAVEAVFAPHEYTIDYWLNGGFFRGSVTTSITLESGSVELAVPEKSGDTFEGWYLTSDYSGEAVERISCTGTNLSLYAKWSNAVYSIRYELGGGILYESNPASVTAETECLLHEPVREGYLFLGWYDGAQGGTKYDRVGGDNAANVTLYALWQKSDALFSVLYDYMGGEATGENPVSVGVGEVYELLPASKAGYTFLGWNTQKDGSGEYVSRLYNVDETLYLYAIFEPKTYVVRYIFEGNYEGDATNPNMVEFGERVTLLPVALYGHEFVGWYDAEEGGNPVAVIDASNILTITTLYARFVPLEFQLHLDAGDGTFVSGGGTQQTLTVGFDERVDLPDCSLLGHDFLGWNDRADGSGEYYQTFTGTEGDQTLYAVYAAREYLIRYEYEGTYESGKVNPNYITYGETVTLYPVYRTGYTFAGWYDAKAGGTRVEVIDEHNIGSVSVLYARFVPLEFAITLDAGDGTFTSPDGEASVYTYRLEYGQTLDLPTCSREGYAFLGWLDEDDNPVEQITAANLGDMSLTASWMQTGVEYRIEYMLDGGAMEGNPETALSDVTVLLNEPVREGYLFLGWYDNPNGVGEPYLSTPFGRTEDLTLYALWQEMTISGSVEFFDYEKTSSEVTITGYHGPTGANVDVIIPSVVDGLPVTRIGSNTMGEYGVHIVRYSIFGAPGTAQIRSLTIPEGVVVLKENAFAALKVAQPLQLPSTLERIEAGAFNSYGGEVLFSDGGNLTYIGESAFDGVRFAGTLVIPHGVEVIDSYAFHNVKVSGVILPDTVETIFEQAFYQPNGYIDRMYLPASVTHIGFRAVRNVYTALSEDRTSTFSSGWGDVRLYNVQASTITLCDGGTRQTLTGEAFDLPSPQKAGYTFLGWQDENGEFVGDCYIPNRNAMLTAVYEKQSEHDGRTLGSAAVLKTDVTYEFTLLDGQLFYFRPDLYQNCRIMISVNGDFRWTLCRIRGNVMETIWQSGDPIDFRAGDVFYVVSDPIPAGTEMTVKIILLSD